MLAQLSLHPYLVEQVLQASHTLRPGPTAHLARVCKQWRHLLLRRMRLVGNHLYTICYEQLDKKPSLDLLLYTTLYGTIEQLGQVQEALDLPFIIRAPTCSCSLSPVMLQLFQRSYRDSFLEKVLQSCVQEGRVDLLQLVTKSGRYLPRSVVDMREKSLTPAMWRYLSYLYHFYYRDDKYVGPTLVIRLSFLPDEQEEIGGIDVVMGYALVSESEEELE